MNKPAAILIAGAGIAAAIIIMRRRVGSDAETIEPITQEEPASPVIGWDAGAADWVTTWSNQAQTEIEENTMPTPDTPKKANIAAMLETISKAEGTDRGDPYRVCYGYKHTIASFLDHPAITGEWRGERLSDALCKGAGLGSGCVSTAAGRYQIIRPTWARLKAKLNLPDFSPASQDAAAIQLLKERGAIAPLEAGDFDAAVFAARKEWASLKGAGYGQGERSMPWLTARFVESGGVLA